MTISELFAQLSVEVLCEGDMHKEISRGVTGDLLSFIMGNAPKPAAWVTILGHINVVAVAVLREIPCIIVAGGKTPDPQMVSRVAQKIGEEGVETALAVALQDKEAVRYEAADLLYHLLVGLMASEISLSEIWEELESRHNPSDSNTAPSSQP